MDLVERVLAGERLALARLLTQVENNTSAGREALERLFSLTGRAHLVGITGAPGTGKSSLANRLALGMRKEGAAKVGVVAVDPTSPFSGGALLGDRLRMKDVAGDAGVFIRSMAARGTLGGLARATAAVVQVLDAAGYDPVLIETVGAGQSEVDIVRLAHTVLVVDAPGMGDDIQAIKAGILEIADVLVVNKADQPGVENTLRALQAMLDIGEQRYAQAGWKPPLLRASAVTGEGIAEILAAIEAHGAYLIESGGRRQRDETRLTREFEGLLQEELLARWRAGTEPERVAAVLARLKVREISPGGAVRELLD